MMESFRTGTTIYPDAMAKKLSYSAGGALYWPSNYVADTNANGYLGKLYTLLKQGKPDLLVQKLPLAGNIGWSSPAIKAAIRFLPLSFWSMTPAQTR